MCAIFGTTSREKFISLYELNKDRGGYASTFSGVKDGKIISHKKEITKAKSKKTIKK